MASHADHPGRVLLVHGAWADGSCWAKVIQALAPSGADVRAVQLSMRTLEEDTATVRRALLMSAKPTVLVGHSYGGAVITASDCRRACVQGLVYIAASAPQEAEEFGTLMTLHPAAVSPETAVDEGGFVWASSPENFREAVAQDMPAAETRVLFAVQKPVHGSLFGASAESCNWRVFPSWYLVAMRDQLFSPETQRLLASRMGAITRIADGGHMLPLSHPSKVADVIREALRGAPAYIRREETGCS